MSVFVALQFHDVPATQECRKESAATARVRRLPAQSRSARVPCSWHKLALTARQVVTIW